MMKILLSSALLIAATSSSASLDSTNAQNAQFAFSALPAQSATTPWPTKEWQREAPDKSVNVATLNAVADSLMKPRDPLLGKTNALLIIHRGKIVFERYAPQHSCDQIEHTMSVAKMMGAAMSGMMIKQGKAQLDQPLGLPHWKKGDPRAAITLRNTLQMATGLGWEEEGDATFFDFSFGEGYSDLALIGALALQKVGPTRSDIAKWVKAEILNPTGMSHTELEFDKKGTWYGSSGVRWSPCDLGRFGTLLLRDGKWDGQTILPEGWVNQMRTPSIATLTAKLPAGAPPEAALYYGFQTFVWDLLPKTVAAPPGGKIPIDAFGHYGSGGYALRVVPSRDVVFISMGVGADDEMGFVKRAAAFKKMTDLFPEAK
jgi:CubicO group peptidase (beta-lactamase class C family)